MIEELNKLIGAFEQWQFDKADFGTLDAEPDWHFQNALREAFVHKKKTIPDSVIGWELFGLTGVDAVAAEMFLKTSHIVDLLLTIDEDHVDYMKVRKMLRDYCHRLNF
jgi:hypothetical protein